MCSPRTSCLTRLWVHTQTKGYVNPTRSDWALGTRIKCTWNSKTCRRKGKLPFTVDVLVSIVVRRYREGWRRVWLGIIRVTIPLMVTLRHSISLVYIAETEELSLRLRMMTHWNSFNWSERHVIKGIIIYHSVLIEGDRKSTQNPPEQSVTRSDWNSPCVSRKE